MTVRHKNRIQAFVLLCAAAALAWAVQKADWPGSIRIQEEFLQYRRHPARLRYPADCRYAYQPV